MFALCKQILARFSAFFHSPFSRQIPASRIAPDSEVGNRSQSRHRARPCSARNLIRRPPDESSGLEPFDAERIPESQQGPIRTNANRPALGAVPVLHSAKFQSPLIRCPAEYVPSIANDHYQVFAQRSHKGDDSRRARALPEYRINRLFCSLRRREASMMLGV